MGALRPRALARALRAGVARGRQPLDEVLTVHDVFDGPMQGVALVHGVPHAYRLEDVDHPGDVFLLKPLDLRQAELVLEDWAIFSRWLEAFEAGDADLSTHPALPADRPRHEAIQGDVFAALGVDAALPGIRRARGSFAREGARHVVRWTLLDA